MSAKPQSFRSGPSVPLSPFLPGAPGLSRGDVHSRWMGVVDLARLMMGGDLAVPFALCLWTIFPGPL